MENNTTETTSATQTSIFDSLNWRSAVKKFDTTKKVSKVDLEKLIDAANLAPTSGGIQPFKLIVVENDEVRSKLRAASFGQSQVSDSSYLFVFASQTKVEQQDVDDYVERMSEVRNIPLEALSQLNQALSAGILGRDEASLREWAARQAYIALGTTISTAAEMRIDTCPMEGFDPQQYSEILDLESKGLSAVVILAVGYRASDDPFANAPKVRKKREDFATVI